MFKSTSAVFAKLPKQPVQGRALRGLFDGKHIYFGNSRSHSEIKTRRPWKPNVQTKHYKSDLLGQVMKVKLTTSAIRSIDKVGGFDNYITETRDERLGYEGSFGVELKRRATKALNFATDGRGMDAFLRQTLAPGLNEKSASVLEKYNQEQREKSIAKFTPEQKAAYDQKVARRVAHETKVRQVIERKAATTAAIEKATARNALKKSSGESLDNSSN